MKESGKSPKTVTKSQMEQSMMKKNKGKEIQPGRIFITKEQVKEMIDNQEKTIYIFELENRRLNIVEFTANFQTSQNIKVLKDDQDSYSLEQPLKTFTVLQPFETKVVARVLVEKGYKLDSNFGINLLAVQKKVQYQYAKAELEKVEQDIKNYSLDMDVSQMMLKEVRERLQQAQCKYVDTTFQANEKSIWGSQEQDDHLDIVIQWKRLGDIYPKDKAVVFANQGPNYIKTGILADNRVVGVLQQLASRGGLVDRLIGNNQFNNEGVYRVRVYYNGVWEEVVVDDYVPCQALGEPLFTHYKDNLQHVQAEIWMLLVEKALAKLMGGYLMLRNIQDQLVQMLTGCPYYVLQVNQLVATHKTYLATNCLVGFQCLSEDELVEDDSPEEQAQRDIFNYNKQNGLVQGYHYSLDSVHVYKNTKVFSLLNYHKSKFQGQLYNESEFKKQFSNTSRYLYVCQEELVMLFSKAIVAVTRNLQEITLRNKFIRIQDIDSNSEETLVKWSYQLDIQEPLKVTIGLHQEDDSHEHVSQARPMLDIGLNIVQILEDNRIDVIQQVDYEFTNYLQHDITFQPGTYILIPKTTGCQLYSYNSQQQQQEQENSNNDNIKESEPKQHEQVEFLDANDQLTSAFKNTLKDIFNKFDIEMTGVLKGEESKELMNYLNLVDNEVHEEHMSLHRFSNLVQHYLVDLKNEQGEHYKHIMASQLQQIGYIGPHLFSSRSRLITFKLFSEDKMSLTVKDNLESDLDQKCLLVNICKQGKELESIKGIRCFYLQHPKVHTYTYAVVNDQVQSIYVTLDSTQSQNMLFSNANNALIQKLVQPDQLVFMYFAQAMTNVTQFYRKIQCTWQHI